MVKDVQKCVQNMSEDMRINVLLYEHGCPCGDIVGSWVMRFNYDFDSWKLGFYADHFFEDDSHLFFLDYNGYGEGPDEWNQKKYSRFFLYSFKDIMLGTELNFKYGKEIDKKKLQMPEAIKAIGTYEVTVKLHPKVSATLRVKVESV